MKKNHINLGTTMKKYMIALIASLMATTLSAQTITAQQEQEFYAKAYDLIVKYGESSAMTKDDAKNRYTFQGLFRNSNISIFNDLMGLAPSEKDLTLSVYRYIQVMKNAKSVEVSVKNLRKGTITDQDSVWVMDVKFDKWLAVSNLNYTLFDSKEFFGQDYRLVATLSLNKVTGECYITDLKADGASPVFPENYRVLQKKEEDKRDNNLYINNRERVRFNSYGQYVLRESERVYYNKREVRLERVEGDDDPKFEANYQDKSWRIRPSFSHSPKFYSMDDDTSLSDDKNNETSFGVDFGYVFRSGSKLHTGIFAGIGLSHSNLHLSATTIADEIVTVDEDVDGDKYDRHYKVWGPEGISQTMKVSELMIPIYVDFEYAFTSFISAYADLGIRMQMTKDKVEKYMSIEKVDNLETWGVYNYKDEYNGLVIRNGDGKGKLSTSGTVDLNGFGLNCPVSIDGKGMDTSTSMDFLAGLGLRININSAFAVDAGVQYITGGNGRKANGNNIFSYDNGDKANLFRKAGGIKHSTSYLRFGASVIYKF